MQREKQLYVFFKFIIITFSKQIYEWKKQFLSICKRNNVHWEFVSESLHVNISNI